jgi:hypothetical protein
MSDRTTQPGDDLPIRPRGRDVPVPPAAPLADREVPLRSDGASAELHAWLDGEGAAPRQADGHLTPEAELWSRIATETKARRDVRTPPHVAAQIMASLPTARPAKAEPVMERPVAAPAPAATSGLRISWPTALLVGAALMAAGVLIGRALAHLFG